MATKKATASPAKKTAAKSADEPKSAAKKAAAKKAPTAEAAAPAKLPGKKKPPTSDEIATLAHQYWQERGGQHGSHNDDWLRAEKELQS